MQLNKDHSAGSSQRQTNTRSTYAQKRNHYLCILLESHYVFMPFLQTHGPIDPHILIVLAFNGFLQPIENRDVVGKDDELDVVLEQLKDVFFGRVEFGLSCKRVSLGDGLAGIIHTFSVLVVEIRKDIDYKVVNAVVLAVYIQEFFDFLDDIFISLNKDLLPLLIWQLSEHLSF